MSARDDIDGDPPGPRPDDVDVETEILNMLVSDASIVLRHLSDLLALGRLSPARGLRLAESYARCQRMMVTQLAIPDPETLDEEAMDDGEDDYGPRPMRNRQMRRAIRIGARAQGALDAPGVPPEVGDAFAMQRLNAHLGALREVRAMGDQPFAEGQLLAGLPVLFERCGVQFRDPNPTPNPTPDHDFEEAK